MRPRNIDDNGNFRNDIFLYYGGIKATTRVTKKIELKKKELKKDKLSIEDIF